MTHSPSALEQPFAFLTAYQVIKEVKFCKGQQSTLNQRICFFVFVFFFQGKAALNWGRANEHGEE